MVAPTSKISEVVDDDAGVHKTSKIQRVKPASKVAVSSSIEEQERGILPWVKSCLLSIAYVTDLHESKCVLVPFSSNAKASEDETMMDLKTFLSTLLTKDDRR